MAWFGERVPARVTFCHLTMVQRTGSVGKSPSVAEQCDANIYSLIHRQVRWVLVKSIEAQSPDGVVWRKGASSGDLLSLDHGSKGRGLLAKCPSVAEQCDANIYSLIHRQVRWVLVKSIQAPSPDGVVWRKGASSGDLLSLDHGSKDGVCWQKVLV
ncbi:hypothetical protein TNCV_1656051 [Trichonephila clavipes]|nr:hypothetical protein TNCV_1656051 [Trichonephila clavipes]